MRGILNLMLLFLGHYIRACFGTTKYCQAFLKGAQCNNPDCLYMHYLVNEGTFTKEEMNSGFSKGKPAFYNLINFDRSKGPVPGSLAKPPKGPGLVKKDSQMRMQPGIDSEVKGRMVHEVDWPHLSQKGRSSLEAVKTDRLSLEIDRTSLLPPRKSAEASWTSTLKSSASGGAFVPSPLQTQTSSQSQKKVAVLSSPVKVKMVSTRSSRGAMTSPSDPPFGTVGTEDRLIPKLSTDSNLSHVSFRSDDQQSLESNISGLYVPPHAAAESRLRETKSAIPLEDDPSRDYASMEAMIRRRTSVPERMIDQVLDCFALVYAALLSCRRRLDCCRQRVDVVDLLPVSTSYSHRILRRMSWNVQLHPEVCCRRGCPARQQPMQCKDNQRLEHCSNNWLRT